MLRVRNQDQLVAQDRERLKIAVVRLKGEESEINVAIQDFARQSLRHLTIDFHFHIRVLLSILQNQMREQIERRALVRADANAPALKRAQLRDSLAHLIAEREDSLRVVIDKLASFRERWHLL